MNFIPFIFTANYKSMRPLIILVLICICAATGYSQLRTDMALKYLVKEPAKRDSKTILIVLLHGYGSNEADLFDLAPQFPSNAVVIAARAPIDVREGSFAWYNINRAGAALANPAEEEKAQALILQLLDQAGKKYNIQGNRTYLMGFSQGAIMSLCTALTHPEKINGIAVMSGRLLDEVKSKTVASDKINKVSIFIGHGTEDKVLPVQYGRDEKNYLESKKIKCEYHEYRMPHSISQDELKDIQQWLGKQLK